LNALFRVVSLFVGVFVLIVTLPIVPVNLLLDRV
jgi:hypothetical protein